MLKLFISYSHKDENKVNDFITYMAPLATGDNKLLDIWYDRNIKAGDDFWDEIDSHLEDRDIVCLFLSKDYIASGACNREMEKALEMRQKLGILVIPVILSKCRWLEANPNLKKLLAATTDAKEISSFKTEDEGWDDVYEHIKVAAESYNNIKELKTSPNFETYLNDAALLAKAHSEKTKLTLDDIYVDQELTIISDKQQENKTTVEKVISEFDQGHKISIIGDDQSGKTSILKKIFRELRKRHFIPIYIKDSEGLMQGKIRNRLEEEFKKQYITNLSLKEFNSAMVVPLIDDFHEAKNKEKILQDLQTYNSCVLMVDDIFSLDVSNERLIIDFKRYRILELKASLRNKLIKNWLTIREGDNLPPFSNADLARIDEMTNVVEQSLGKAFGKGIMPAHPFFILYVLSTYDFEMQPGGSYNITSQGHCYQALIYFFLRSKGVDNDNVDGYLNFFTEFAQAIYENKGNELNPEQYEDFLRIYSNEFNFVEPRSEFLRKVYNSGIITVSSFNTYSFGYPYLYYFFAGKFFSEQWNDSGSKAHKKYVEEVQLIMRNLHKTSNAYIAIFIAHHTKNLSLLKLIVDVADNIFSKYSPATFDKHCLAVFQKQAVVIPQPSLPSRNNVEVNRANALKIQDEIEAVPNEVEFDDEEASDELSVELRRSAKTVEVIGAILKNRAGSLGNEQLKNLFITGINVHLRQTSSFLALVEKMTEEDNYSDFFVERIRDNYPDESEERLKQKANQFFWSGNFAFIFGTVRKISKSLGSNKLTNIVKDVCDKLNTPASFMIKHTILMWSNKNLRINELLKMDKILDCPISKYVMMWLITEYCTMHRIDYKDSSKLEQLGIKAKALLPKTDKE